VGEDEPVTGDERGERDVASVTVAGRSVRRSVDGVVVHTPTVHVDHRGWVFEMHNLDPALGDEPLVWAYADMVRPGQIKGWARHEVKIDRYTLVAGSLLMLLHDSRPGSPTHCVTQDVVLSPLGTRQIRIPVGVWHLLANVGTDEALFVNLPTEPYHHDAPDRILLDWDTDELPVDVRSYLPKF
jgi:dTDP-4-dehydrorhamnose 3,5-epimerase